MGDTGRGIRWSHKRQCGAMTLGKRLLRLETKAGQTVDPGAEIDRIFLVAEGVGSEAVKIFRRGADGKWRAVQNGEVYHEL